MSFGLLVCSFRSTSHASTVHRRTRLVQASFIRTRQPQTLVFRSISLRRLDQQIWRKYTLGRWSSLPDSKKAFRISLVDFCFAPQRQKKPPQSHFLASKESTSPRARSQDDYPRLESSDMSEKHSLEAVNGDLPKRQRQQQQDHENKYCQRKKHRVKNKLINGRPWRDANNDEILEIEVRQLLEEAEGEDLAGQSEQPLQEQAVEQIGADASRSAIGSDSELQNFLRTDGQHAQPSVMASEPQNKDHVGNVQTVTQPQQQPVEQSSLQFELEIVETSSTGDGLALHPNRKHVFVVPFSIKGDIVLAKPFGRSVWDHWSRADFVKVLKPSPLRDDSRIRCKHFAACGGCQFQMMSQEDQLGHKKKVVQRAFAAFSNMDPKLVPEVRDTLASPLQYDYRTKLTPHFDGPPGMHRRVKYWQQKPTFETVPSIGYTLRNRHKVLDIEECPIGTKAVQYGLTMERRRMETEFSKYTKGATILLRETTKREDKTPGLSLDSFEAPEKRETETYFETKNYVSANNAIAQEYVNDILFVNSANSFFQNNNSILSQFLDYIKECLFPQEDTQASNTQQTPSGTRPKYLIDAYCGSGLFTVTLSKYFERSIGVDIDVHGIRHAMMNAESHGIEPDKARFKTANAGEIFNNIDFPPEETVMIIDPPRKGCDMHFLKQLLLFGPETVVYVSCNVHTQARDIGFLSHGAPAEDEQSSEHLSYELQSLRGCDFFPQTAHVEGVAVLRRKRLAE